MVRNVGVCGEGSTKTKDCFIPESSQSPGRGMHEKAGAWDTGQDQEVTELMGKD